ncbi:hypothetical protein [Saccharopolyspora soli]|nr:hypothetical protein [Saccharopolyspora soli]
MAVDRGPERGQPSRGVWAELGEFIEAEPDRDEPVSIRFVA